MTDYLLFYSSLLCMCFGSTSGFYLLSARVLGRRAALRPWLLYFAVFTVIQIAMNLLALSGRFPYSILLWDVGLLTLQNVFLGLILCRAYGESFLKTFSAAALSNFILYTCYSILNALMRRVFPLDDVGTPGLYALLHEIVPHFLILLCAVLVGLVLRRVRFSEYFSYLFTTAGKAGLTFALCFVLMNAYALLSIAFPRLIDTTDYAALSLTGVLLVLFLLQFAAMFALNREKLRTQEETILQQQAHLRLLEELQAELKAFRHDFHNLLSGAALRADEEDVAGLNEFLRSTTGYFDQKLGDEIKQMGVLEQVRIYPLRSLLTIKLAALRERGIRTELEILLPVTDCGMREEDMVRCAGILLDNAAEAAARHPQGLVRILLLQEERELWFAVSNTCPEKPDIRAMQAANYTTKGEGRGVGLSSYRRILTHYPGCVSRTHWKDGLLTQELRAGLA